VNESTVLAKTQRRGQPDLRPVGLFSFWATLWRYIAVPGVERLKAT
jgi:hypothetical protein